MLAMYLRLIVVISYHFCQADHNHNVARTLTKAVRKSLTVDKPHISEATEEEIGARLDTPKGETLDLHG